jgi:hypothetical protein
MAAQVPKFVPLREKPVLSGYKKGDYLVLFGELFQRGYANGLVEEAERRGLRIIRSTVGRREKDGTLRPLTEDEVKSQPQPFINVPLEAGFDMSADSSGKSPVDYLKDAKLSDWKSLKLDFDRIEESRKNGVESFKKRVQQYMTELQKIIEPGYNVLFAHLMAGGVPRAKIVMPLMNRAFKGRGERYLSSREFWDSDIGKLNAISFQEVTANTFQHLLELSAGVRAGIEKAGGRAAYVAYGYHGTEVLIGKDYKWSTYTPYLQGWAKLQLEEISRRFHQQGLHTCVYNCPEILTNSSSIFQGVENYLYMLLEALKKEAPNSPRTQSVTAHCQGLLKDEFKISTLIEDLQKYFKDPAIVEHSRYDMWPQHSSQQHMERMLDQSDKMVSWHKDEKHVMTTELSELVFEGCGYAMLHDSWATQEPVRWLGHDIVVKCLPNT